MGAPLEFDPLTAALAECTAMTVRWFAQKRGWPVEQVEVVVEHGKNVAIVVRMSSRFTPAL